MCHIQYLSTLGRHTPYGRHTEYHLLAGYYSVMSQLLFHLHLKQTELKKKKKLLAYWLNPSVEEMAPPLFRGGARRAGRRLLCRASRPLLRRHGLVRGIMVNRVQCGCTQFLNQALTHLASISGIKHNVTISYSKEENGIVERANKETSETSWRIRTAYQIGQRCYVWQRNSLTALGVSTNTLLFGDAIPPEQSLMAKIDQIPSATNRDNVDKLMDWRSSLIVVTVKSCDVNDYALRRFPWPQQ